MSEYSEYIRAYEYESNVNPNLKQVPIVTKNSSDVEYGITFINFNEIYNVKHKATTPNLLASFIKLEPNTEIHENNDSDMNGSSHLFYIINGNGLISINDGETYQHFHVSSEDIFVSPFFNSISIKNNGDEELCIYYINDSPLVNYLGCSTKSRTFRPTIYSKEFIQDNLIRLSNPNNNRKGILLSNEDTEIIGVNTITPVLWSLYNELPPNTKQRPHKHNSVALDLCVKCDDYENVYTLVGEKLDENGNIIDPIQGLLENIRNVYYTPKFMAFPS